MSLYVGYNGTISGSQKKTTKKERDFLSKTKELE